MVLPPLQPQQLRTLVGYLVAPMTSDVTKNNLSGSLFRPELVVKGCCAHANYPGQRFMLRNGSPSDPGCAQPRVGQDFPPFFVITSKLGMSDDHDVSLMRMDIAFCARLLAAIEAGLESAPIGVVATPGTESPKYVKAEPRPPASPLGDI